MSKKIEYKNINPEDIKSFERKADGEYKGRLLIKGYAAVFGNEDSYGDIIEKGAFENTINGDNFEDIAFCYQHDMRRPIGNILKLEEDNYGLKFEAVISASEEGVAIKLEEGILKKFSIGYWTIKKEIIENEDGSYKRYLKELGLAEFSTVTRAANKLAKITDQERKSEDFELKYMDVKELELLQDKLEQELKSRQPKTWLSFIK